MTMIRKFTSKKRTLTYSYTGWMNVLFRMAVNGQTNPAYDQSEHDYGDIPQPLSHSAHSSHTSFR
jgi:hypothetical protein